MRQFDFEQKRKTRKMMGSPFVVIILFFVFLFLGNAVWNAYQEYSEAKKKEYRAEKDLDDLLSRKEQLTKEIERLQTEQGFEEEVRKQFGLGKPGEGVIIVVDRENTETEIVREISFWEKIVDFFR